MMCREMVPALALAPERIVKALKKFHQSCIGFHARALIRSESQSINGHG